MRHKNAKHVCKVRQFAGEAVRFSEFGKLFISGAAIGKMGNALNTRPVPGAGLMRDRHNRGPGGPSLKIVVRSLPVPRFWLESMLERKASIVPSR